MLADSHLAGIVWSGFLGLTIGNFLTSPIYRLPRGKPLSVEDPYCDTCHARLGVKDLFPVFSWLASCGKCRHCGARISGAYPAIEAFTGLLFIACFLIFGFTEPFILVSFGMAALMALAVMLSAEGYFSHKTFFVSLVFGALFRTLQGGTIYGFAGGGFTGLLAGVIACKVARRPLARDLGTYPDFLKLLVLAGVWLPLYQMPIVFVAAMFAAFFKKRWPLLPEWTIIACTMLQVLFQTHFTVSL